MAEPAGLPPWSWAAIGAAILGAGRLLWGALQKQNDREVKTLNAENGYLKGLLQSRDAELARVRYEYAATVEKLGKKVDVERAKTERVALLLVQSSTVQQIEEFDDAEENTAVHRAVTVAKAAISRREPPVDPFGSLEGWDPKLKTPIPKL